MNDWTKVWMIWSLFWGFQCLLLIHFSFLFLPAFSHLQASNIYVVSTSWRLSSTFNYTTFTGYETSIFLSDLQTPFFISYTKLFSICVSFFFLCIVFFLTFYARSLSKSLFLWTSQREGSKVIVKLKRGARTKCEGEEKI